MTDTRTAKTTQYLPGPLTCEPAVYSDEKEWSVDTPLRRVALVNNGAGNAEAYARLFSAAMRMVKSIKDTRLILGALRQYVPNDLLPNINNFLVYLGGIELDATGTCSHEGDGWSDAAARAIITKVMTP